MEQEKVHVRLLILAGVALLWMTAVFGRLTYLQFIRHSDYISQAHAPAAAHDRYFAEARRHL